MECFASLQSYENAGKILEKEHLGIAAVVKYGLISMGLSMDDRLYEESLQTCFFCWLHKVVESYVSNRACVLVLSFSPF